MKKIIFITGFVALLLTACNQDTIDTQQVHDHGDVKLQLVSYSQDLEFYAEADPFVLGQESIILAHFTNLKAFDPIETSSITLSLIVGSKGVRQTIDHPVNDGIYSFNITPVESGRGKLVFEIINSQAESSVEVENIVVYQDSHDAIHIAEELVVSDPNAIVFTKEQSWKIGFSTVEVTKDAFGQVIKTGAMIKSSKSDRVSLVARTSGIVVLPGANIFEGTAVKEGEELFRVSGSGMAGENTHVRYMEAKSNYEEARANYERLKVLAADRIVPDSELLESKRRYETARVTYESLKENFEGGEQIVNSPVSGYVDHIYISNGQYVEAGQPLIDVAQNKKLVLIADVRQRYATALENIITANVRSVQDKETYTLEELNGSLSAYGRSVNPDNFMIPVHFEIDNTKGFIPGSFVELYIITLGSQDALSVPNSALLEEQGKYFVLAQLTPELFEKKEVVTGASDGMRTEIITGLANGDRVIDKGAILVKLSQSSGSLDPHAGHVH